MSAPRVIAELVVTGIRVLGKATAAAGAQAVRNFKVKPEGAVASTSTSGGGGKGNITSQLNMSLDEAHLILNVKKDDPMEIIQKNYERIFAANGPPAPPAAEAVANAGAAAAAQARRSTASARKSKIPTHSHYLHSKVYRALERIKAEREADAPPPPTETAGGGVGSEATEARPAAEAETAKPEEKKPEPEYKKPPPVQGGGTIEL